MDGAPLELGTLAWRLAATFLFVLAQRLLVAAEFALVKVRPTRIEALAAGGGAARVVASVLGRLDLYLSGCQLGITVASLILGWLAEPAIAKALIAGAHHLGLSLSPSLLHAVALCASADDRDDPPHDGGRAGAKIWANPAAGVGCAQGRLPAEVLHRVAAPADLADQRHLQLVVATRRDQGRGRARRIVFRRRAQRDPRGVLPAATITPRQRQFTENVLGFINLEVRHIMVPRVEVALLSVARNQRGKPGRCFARRSTRASRCAMTTSTNVIGIIHAKDVLRVVTSGTELDFKAIARKPVFVPTPSRSVG